MSVKVNEPVVTAQRVDTEAEGTTGSPASGEPVITAEDVGGFTVADTDTLQTNGQDLRLAGLASPGGIKIGGFTLPNPFAGLGQTRQQSGVTVGGNNVVAPQAQTQPTEPTRLPYDQLQNVDVDAIMKPPADGTSPLLQHPGTKGATDARGREITNPREHVVILEQLLNAAEGTDHPVTGEYTEKLGARVLRFQKNHSLQDDSVGGPRTMRRALELALANTPEPGNPVRSSDDYDYASVLAGKVLRIGDRGEEVAAVKRLLSDLDIPVDLESGDVYTEETAAAVTDFQERARVFSGNTIDIDGVFGHRESLPNALRALEATRTEEWAREHVGPDGQPLTFGAAIRPLDERTPPVEVRLTEMPSTSDIIPRFAAMTHQSGEGTKALQRELHNLGYDVAPDAGFPFVDGDRGRSTEAAEADVRDLYTILTGNELPPGIEGTRIAIQHMLFPEGPASAEHDPDAVTLLHTLPEYMRAGNVRKGRGNRRVVVRMMAPAGEYSVNSLSGGEGMLQTRAALSFVAMRDRIRGLGMREEFRSGWRSYAHQAHLRRIYARRGGVAAPGRSAHHDGMEVDFVIPTSDAGGRGWLVTNSEAYGFYDPKHTLRNGRRESWAWQHRGNVTERVTDYWRVATNPRPEAPPQAEVSGERPMRGGFDFVPGNQA